MYEPRQQRRHILSPWALAGNLVRGTGEHLSRDLSVVGKGGGGGIALPRLLVELVGRACETMMPGLSKNDELVSRRGAFVGNATTSVALVSVWNSSCGSVNVGRK